MVTEARGDAKGYSAGDGLGTAMLTVGKRSMPPYGRDDKMTPRPYAG